MSKQADAPSGAAGPSPPSGVTTSAAEPTVSKYAGQPGALTALRVDYTTRDRAFAPHSSSTALGKVREEVKQLSSGPRLGDKPAWTTSSSTAPMTGIGAGGVAGSVHHAPPASCIGTAVPGLPQRAMTSQNSAYQAVKLNYNYRADALPPVKEILYIPKHNKMEVDKTVFLLHGTSKTTTVIADKCLTTATNLSRVENQNTFGGKRSGDVRPLSDTFGDHNVRRHMSLREPQSPNGTAKGRRGSALDEDGLDSTGGGGGGLGGTHAHTIDAETYHSTTGPVTLRDRNDIDVGYYYTQQQLEAHAKASREAGWNTSAALGAERTNVYKLREYKDYRRINKQKEGSLVLRGLGGSGGMGATSNATTTATTAGGGGPWDEVGATSDPDIPIGIDVAAELAASKAAKAEGNARRLGVYVTPIERQKHISLSQRELKLSRRRTSAQAAEREAIDVITLGGSTVGHHKGKGSVLANGGTVYKMSNKEEWWSALPAEVERCRATLAASHVKASDGFNADGPEKGKDVKKGSKERSDSDTDSDA